MKDQINWAPIWWAFLSVKEAHSEFRESRFLISISNVLHWSHSRGRFELRYDLIFPFSVYNSTSSLSWMPSLFLHFLFPSITSISSWIYFGSISQKSKVPLPLGSRWGTQKGREGATKPVEMHWGRTWLTHLPRDSSITPTPSSAARVLWVQSSRK